MEIDCKPLEVNFVGKSIDIRSDIREGVFKAIAIWKSAGTEAGIIRSD